MKHPPLLLLKQTFQFTAIVMRTPVPYVYVTGCSGSGTYYSGGNYSTIKLDPNNGDLLWTRYYRSPYIGNPELSEAHAIAVDQNNDILVTGTSDGVGYYDFATVKYDTVGNELWIRRYESGSWDEANDLAIDSEGNIYVTGRRCTVKYDSEGNELWYTSHDLGEEPNLLGNDLILGPQGHVYVTGHRNDPNDYATAKFDPEDGTVLWWAFFAGEDHGFSGTDIATAIDLDSYGNIYVTGYFASNSTGATVRYRQFRDRDGDGHVAGEDCDDFNPTIWDCNTPRSEDPVEIVGNCGETISYPAVSAGGDTMLDCGICESPPEGIFLPGTAPLCIDIDLSATLVFTGEAAVCVPYNDAGMELADEQNLRMVRCDESEKCEVLPLCTGQVDTDNNIVCGCTDQFSMFTVGTLMDSDGDTIPDLLDNCPHDINWFQEDDDGDEIGNICDNCPDVWDPTNQCSVCEGDAEPDGDVDGRDLATFAAGQFNDEGLLGFSSNFGRNDCLLSR
jgi:hypothetical protein